MKNIMKLLGISLFAILFLGCSSSRLDDNMFVSKGKLSNDELSTAEFLGVEEELYIIDYNVNDTIKSLTVNLYELIDKQWEVMSISTQELINNSARIAFSFDNLGLEYKYMVEEDGTMHYKNSEPFNFESTAIATSYLTEKTAIEIDKEIPLIIQVHSLKDNVSSYIPALGFFETHKYAIQDDEKVYAITIVFN